MKVKELSEWPPSNFGSKGIGGTIPTHAQQVTIGDVLNTLADNVFFSCKYGDQTVTCTFFVPNAITAKKVAAILKEHKGENLLSIAEVEIPAE
jgi:hypothetical protein